MPCSMSRPSAESAGGAERRGSAATPAVSVVIAATGPVESLEACLAALEAQRDGAEVLVCEAVRSPDLIRGRFPWASFLERAGALAPRLWSEGIEQATGTIVALTIGSVRPAADWLETIRDRHRRYDVVAGAIDPADDLRLADWAEYFCRYARDMRPFAPHECRNLPGDNSAYKRDLLVRRRELYADGFWEPEVNRALAADGIVLWHDPAVLVRHGRSRGAAAFSRQRLVHGRVYGRQRAARFSRARNAIGVVAAPVVPALMTKRVLSEVFRRRRHRLRALAALPLTFWFNLAWAAGEARGHLDALRV